MTITDRLLTPGAAHGRPGTAIKPVGVVIHYVGNPGSSAEANRNYFEAGAAGGRASAHYIVGLKGEILRCIPETELANHAGKSYGAQWDAMAKTNNHRYIGVETCHPDATGKFSDITMESLIWLVSDICVRRGFDPRAAVLRHYDVSGKSCPLYYVKNPAAWTALKDKIIARVVKPKPLVELVAEKIGLNSPGLWQDVIDGKRIATADQVRSLFEKIAAAI
jgi:N-acetylmuramoyl-L-alanine amidase